MCALYVDFFRFSHSTLPVYLRCGLYFFFFFFLLYKVTHYILNQEDSFNDIWSNKFNT